jgi:hypothetical protein
LFCFSDSSLYCHLFSNTMFTKTFTFLIISGSYLWMQSLATQVRKQLHASRTKGEPVEGFNFSTTTLLTRYLEVWQIIILQFLDRFCCLFGTVTKVFFYFVGYCRYPFWSSYPSTKNIIAFCWKRLGFQVRKPHGINLRVRWADGISLIIGTYPCNFVNVFMRVC